MIKPTIGRVVWFTPPKDLRSGDNQPWPAFITYVHGDRMINVAGFTSGGESFFQHSVTLLQGDEGITGHEFYASWMPYQVAQAAAQVPASPQPLTSATIDFSIAGPLNEYGAHKMLGVGRQDMWYFTLLGWDRATTALQRANIAKQLSLDPLTGVPGGSGPPPDGFSEGNPVAWFRRDLIEPDGPDGVGGLKWKAVDESADKGWSFLRLRIRSRDINELVEIAERQKAPL